MASILLKKPVISLSGKPHKLGREDMTLGDLVIDGLLAVTMPGEDPEGRYARYTLAKRLYEQKSVAEPTELTGDEAEMIKTCVGAKYPPSLMGPLWDELNQ